MRWYPSTKSLRSDYIAQINRRRGRNMIEKLQKLRIEKRLTQSSTVTVLFASIAAIIAAILLIISGRQYNKVLTYYAFPQGDIGIAMKELADVRSATRGAIGYSEQDQIDQMVQIHDEAVEAVKNQMPKIKESIITKVGEEDYAAIESALDAYLEVDQKIIDLGATTDDAQSK